jgi:thiosulfate reductase cytochrome b subunit
MTNQVLIYKGFERFWHWMQAALIIFLATTGFEIHGSFTFLGYENAVTFHNVSAYALLALTAFAIFWHFTTGEWRNYIPTLKNMKAQIEYYLIGIFRNAPHPYRKNSLSKLNPLQRITYLGLKILVLPVMAISGLLYMFYRYSQNRIISGIGLEGLTAPAAIHTAGAFALIAFLVIHVYLVSTGETPASNLKAMLTGYEEVEEDAINHNGNGGVVLPDLSEKILEKEIA